MLLGHYQHTIRDQDKVSSTNSIERLLESWQTFGHISRGIFSMVWNVRHKDAELSLFETTAFLFRYEISPDGLARGSIPVEEMHGSPLSPIQHHSLVTTMRSPGVTLYRLRLRQKLEAEHDTLLSLGLRDLNTFIWPIPAQWQLHKLLTHYWWVVKNFLNEIWMEMETNSKDILNKSSVTLSWHLHDIQMDCE